MQFNELQAVGLFLASDGISTHTDPFTSGKKYCTLVNNAVVIHNKTCFSNGYLCIPIRAHTMVATAGYETQTIKYGKIFAMWVYGEYYERVYKVHNTCWDQG